MANYITINGENFEVIKPRNGVDTNEVTRYIGKDIWDFYDRPSMVKEDIWNSWLRWCAESNIHEVADIHNFCVTGANTSTFSISFLACVDGIEYLGKVTKAHNRLYLIG